MKSYVRILIAAGVACASLSSCTTLPGYGDEAMLAGTSWRLVGTMVGGNRTTLPSDMQQRHRIAFDRDGSMQLTLDCNTGRATWNAREDGESGGTLSIGQISSTRAFCPRPSYGDEMSTELSSARTYLFVPATNRLRIQTRRTEFIFERLRG